MSRSINEQDRIAPGLAVKRGDVPGWQPITEMPLLIFVGVTGVGKSTILAHLTGVLTQYATAIYSLPNRRELTDRLIIGQMQELDGYSPSPVTDRYLRFDYTKRYREHFAGGMAYALSQMVVAREFSNSLLIFDGLRGENEVIFAAKAFPQASFLLLDAPDLVRVQRLLGRGDAFDTIGVAEDAPQATQNFHSLGLPEAAALFSKREEQILFGLVDSGQVTTADLLAKLRIVVEERRNYDPRATRRFLQQAAPERIVQIDTTDCPPSVAAQRMTQHLLAKGMIAAPATPARGDDAVAKSVTVLDDAGPAATKPTGKPSPTKTRPKRRSPRQTQPTSETGASR